MLSKQGSWKADPINYFFAYEISNTQKREQEKKNEKCKCPLIVTWKMILRLDKAIKKLSWVGTCSR